MCGRTDAEEEEEGEATPRLYQHDDASSDIRFYKERAGILEGSRRGTLLARLVHRAIGGGININYVPKGCLRLPAVILPGVSVYEPVLAPTNLWNYLAPLLSYRSSSSVSTSFTSQ